MPELPEVETVRRGLEVITHTVIETMEIYHYRAVRHTPADLLPIEKHLCGKQVCSPQRRGKYIWIPLRESSQKPASLALIIHLGMSGQILINPTQHHRHQRITLSSSHNDQKFITHFVDQRTFGFFALSTLDAAHSTECISYMIPHMISHIAPDIFAPEDTDTQRMNKLSVRKTPIKPLLLQQNIISGIGNIYADEALWQTGIHPASQACNIPRDKLLTLLINLRIIMTKAMEDGGTSFDALYVSVNGQSGNYSQKLNAYGRGGKPCKNCGNILEKHVLQQRSTVICTVCQYLY